MCLPNTSDVILPGIVNELLRTLCQNVFVWYSKYVCIVPVKWGQFKNPFCSHLPSEEDGEHEKKKIWYYSTKAQLVELMMCLDKEYWEMDLHATLEEMKEEVQAHMDITEDLTNKARGNNKAYLTAVNGTDLMLSSFSNTELYLNLTIIF